MTPSPSPRWDSLDALRGLAALAVVVWHWQHFQFLGSAPGPGFDRSLQPAYPLLRALYEHGDAAVDLFFVLSGQVFAGLYAAPLAARTVSGLDFARRRLARLYPLHALTLLAVAAGQALAAQQGPAYAAFVYPFQDAWHFLLHLGLIPAWGLEQGHAYNAPVWSVSVEVLLYALFWALCRSGLPRVPGFLALAALGAWAVMPLNPALGRGLEGFFLGALLPSLRAGLARLDPAGRRQAPLALAVALGWLLLLSPGGLLAPAPALPGLEALRALGRPGLLALFAATVLVLVDLETAGRLRPPRPLAALGELSYGVYLLHFPLQLACVLLSDRLGLDRSVYQAAVAMPAFMVLLLALAGASHRGFERPMQAWLRGRPEGRPQPPA